MPKSPNIFILNNSEKTISLRVLNKFDYTSYENHPVIIYFLSSGATTPR